MNLMVLLIIQYQIVQFMHECQLLFDYIIQEYLFMDFRPGQKEQPSGKLDQYLAKQDFDLSELFSIPNILADIKINITKFVKYLSTRRKLMQQLIYFATRQSEEQLKDQCNRKFCFISIEILSNYSQQLISIFFKQKQTEDIIEQISVNNEIQNLLFGNDDVMPEGNDPFQPSEMLSYLLDYLFEGNINGMAKNNYFSKMIHSMIRQSGCNFLQFMIEHPRYIDKLIQKVDVLSLGLILMRILSIDFEESNNKRSVTSQKCQQFKTNIVRKLKQKYIQNIENLEFCESIGLLIEEGFQSIKNKYFQFPQDLVEAFNILVNNQTISYFGSQLTQTSSPNVFTSISMYLTLVLKKLNKQIQQFYQNQRDKKNLKNMLESDYILKFQISWLTDHFLQIIQLLENPIFKDNPNINKHRFTSALVELVKIPQLWIDQPKLDSIFSNIFNHLIKSGGVLQNDFYIITRTLIQKCSKQALEFITQAQVKTYLDQKFRSQTKNINNFTCLGPILDIVFLIQQKNTNFKVSQSIELSGKSLKQIKLKHNSVLGGKQTNQSKSLLLDEDSQGQVEVFEEQVVRLTNQDIQNKIQMVGKMKNIPLPNLRYMSQIRKEQQKQKQPPKNSEQFQALLEQEKNNVYQIQEQQLTITIPCRTQKQQLVPTQSQGQQNNNDKRKAGVETSQQNNKLMNDSQPAPKQTFIEVVAPKTDSVPYKQKRIPQPSRQLLRFYSALYLII